MQQTGYFCKTVVEQKTVSYLSDKTIVIPDCSSWADVEVSKKDDKHSIFQYDAKAELNYTGRKYHDKSSDAVSNELGDPIRPCATFVIRGDFGNEKMEPQYFVLSRPEFTQF